MTLAEINYMEQQLFQVAPLPLYDGGASYPDGFDLQIKCASAGDRPASQTNWLKITPEQLQKIERILLGDL